MMIAIGIPRLHDIGRTGWLVGVAILAEIVVLVGVAVAGASVDTIYVAAGFVFLRISALGIWLGIIPGQAETNKWGDPPGPDIQFGRRKASLTNSI
jgi:uncharacterized membrane protein YhaH (DUF805 family)